MPRRIGIVLAFAIVSILLAGSLLFGGIPRSYSPNGFTWDTPKVPGWGGSHEVSEEPTSSNLQPEAGFTPPTDSNSKNDQKGSTDPDPAPEKAVPPTAVIDGPLHITITETGGSHDEVVAALVHSFGSQPNAEIDLFQLLPRYGIKEIMRAFSLTNPFRGPNGPDNFMKEGSNAAKPTIFVAGTCELDIIRLKTQLDTLLAEGNTYMFCVVHHADRWANPEMGLEAAIRPWVEKSLVEFWSLSPHTARFLQTESISKWSVVTSGKIQPLVRYFVPVFPVALPPAPEGHGEDKEELAFGLQGDYDPARRDYNSIFERLGSFLKTDGSSGSSPADDESHSRNVTMHLLGHGNHPAVPDDIRDHVIFDERLDYIDYYSILSKTFALLPAFASDDYLDRKASSSVPAALIAGTPLVATQAILDSYSYMTRDSVWLQDAEESDFDVVGKVLEMGPKERRKKNELVKKRCADIVEGNTRRVGDWIVEAVEKMKSKKGGSS